MSESYYSLWTDALQAERMLTAAVSSYVSENLFGRVSDPPPHHFALDANSDAVNQLVEFRDDLLKHAPAAAGMFDRVARQAYQINCLSSPPRYFEAAIFGHYLLIVSERDEKPNPGAMLRFFRPLLDSNRPRETDLYFSMVQTVGDVVTVLPVARYEQAIQALRAEWEYLRGRNASIPAGLARILTRARPSEWPSFLLPICEGNWSSASAEAHDTNEFVRAVQNIVGDISSEVIAAEFWQLADYLFASNPRAKETVRSMFSSDDARYKFNATAPFRLITPSDDPLDLTEWRVAARNPAVATSSFPFAAGSLERPDMSSKRRQVAYNIAKIFGMIALGVSVYAAAA